MLDRKPYRPSTPDEAYQIAAHTTGVLQSMRSERNLGKLKETFGHWRNWSDANSVCRPIVEHMIGAYCECAAALGEKQPGLSDRSKAMAGEQA